MTPEQQRLLDKADKTLQAALLCEAFFYSDAPLAYYVIFYVTTAFLE